MWSFARVLAGAGLGVVERGAALDAAAMTAERMLLGLDKREK